MIRRLIRAYSARRLRLRADLQALDSYRSQIPLLRRWLTDMPDICAALDQLAFEAGDKGMDADMRLMGPSELRDRMREMRRAQHNAAHEKTLRDALMHVRLLSREIDGVGETWADERTRRSLNGGTVTLGELRAAKRFINRVDSERIAAREGTKKK